MTPSSLNEYIDFIHDYQKNAKTELWYRGQRNNMWKLDSTLNREKELDNPTLGLGQITLLKYKNVLDFTLELDEFKKQLNSIPNTYNKFHLMFLGQHYGLKTPALDWSTDPLVGLFFALYDFKYKKNVYPVVFILKPAKLNSNSSITINGKPICEPLNIDKLSDSIFDKWFINHNNTPFSLVPFAVKSNYDISYRISRQSGVFTLMDTRQTLSYPWIQTNIDGEPFGITIKINPAKADDILQHLPLLQFHTCLITSFFINLFSFLTLKIEFSTS